MTLELEDASMMLGIFFKLGFIVIGLLMVISGIIQINTMTVTAGVELPMGLCGIITGLIILYFTDFFHYLAWAWNSWN